MYVYAAEMLVCGVKIKLKNLNCYGNVSEILSDETENTVNMV